MSRASCLMFEFRFGSCRVVACQIVSSDLNWCHGALRFFFFRIDVLCIASTRWDPMRQSVSCVFSCIYAHCRQEVRIRKLCRVASCVFSCIGVLTWTPSVVWLTRRGWWLAPQWSLSASASGQYWRPRLDSMCMMCVSRLESMCLMCESLLDSI